MSVSFVSRPAPPTFRLPAALARVGVLGLKLALPLAVFAFLFVARHNTYWLGAAWGLAMFVSMNGWGMGVEYLVRPRRPIDFGLSIVWGIAATLALGGIACLLHLAQRPFLIAQVIVGLLLAAGMRLRRWRSAPSRRRLLAALARPSAYLIVAAALAAIANGYLGEIGDYRFNVSDDQILYFYLAQKILQTGSPYDPFNSRRVVLYGGIDYLNAQFASIGRNYQLHVVDGGVGALMLFAIVVGAAAPRGLRRANPAALAVALLLFATLGDVRVNVGSLLTGAACFLGTYRTILWIHDEGSDRRPLDWRRLALVGACVMATSILRPSNAVPLALIVGLTLLGRRLRTLLRISRFTVHTIRELWSIARDAVYSGVSCFAFLLPWLIVFHESVGTIAYPLLKGNATPGFAILKHEPGFSFNLRHLILDLSFSPIDTSLILLTAGLLPLGWGAVRPKAPADFATLLSVGCLLSLCFSSYTYGAFDNWVDARYTYACVVATVFAIVVSIAGRRGWAREIGASPRALLVVAAVAVHVAAHRDVCKTTALSRVDTAEHGRTKLAEDEAEDRNATRTYREIQGHLPAHETVVVCVPEPFRFDMRRNVVFNLDAPGGLGPSPGFPLHQGPEVLADYLVHNGVRYLITVNFHAAMDLLNVDFWHRIVPLEHNYGAYEAPIIIDAMNSLEKVVQAHHTLYEGAGMKVTDLLAPP